jgi:hypothetical protein
LSQHGCCGSFWATAVNGTAGADEVIYNFLAAEKDVALAEDVELDDWAMFLDVFTELDP